MSSTFEKGLSKQANIMLSRSIALVLVVLPIIDNLTGYLLHGGGDSVSIYLRGLLLALLLTVLLMANLESGMLTLLLSVLLVLPIVVRSALPEGLAGHSVYNLVSATKIIYGVAVTETLVILAKRQPMMRKVLITAGTFGALIYVASILIFWRLEGGLSAYSNAGNSGFMRAANDVSLLLSIAIPMVAWSLRRLFPYPIFFLVIVGYAFALVLLTTKSGFLGIAMIAVILGRDLWRQAKTKKGIFIIFVVLLPSLVALPSLLKTPTIQAIVGSYTFLYETHGWAGVLLRGRQHAFLNFVGMAENLSVGQLLFGLGQGEFGDLFARTSYEYYKSSWKIAEVDQIDLFFSYGIIGSFAVLGYYVVRTLKTHPIIGDGLPLWMSLAVFWIHALAAGHAITSPIVTTYFAIIVAVGCCGQTSIPDRKKVWKRP